MSRSCPKKQQYWFFEFLWSMPFTPALGLLFGAYIAINALFSLAEWQLEVLKCFDPKTSKIIHPGCIDYIYFGFVTGTTVGYGDFSPCTAVGKLLAIAHALSSTLTFALLVAFIAVKALSPRNTIVFSDRLCLDRKRDKMYCRVINTHRSRLLAPEVRVSATQHAVGNMIAGACFLRKIDDLPWFDRHDFSIDVPLQEPVSGFDLVREWESALAHNAAARSQGGAVPESRFKIEIVITGMYATQVYAQETRFWADDIVEGAGFRAIQYNKEDQRRVLPIRYTKFRSFWAYFNMVEKAQDE